MAILNVKTCVLYRNNVTTPTVNSEQYIRSLQFFADDWIWTTDLFFVDFVFLTINSKYVQYNFLPMTAFEPRTSCIRKDHSANWATTKGHGAKVVGMKTDDKLSGQIKTVSFANRNIVQWICLCRILASRVRVPST